MIAFGYVKTLLTPEMTIHKQRSLDPKHPFSDIFLILEFMGQRFYRIINN